MAIERAIILASMEGARDEAARPRADVRLAGLTLLERAVLAVQHCGAAELLIVTNDPARAGDVLAGDPRLRASVRAISTEAFLAGEAALDAGALYLLLPIATLISREAIRELAQRLEHDPQGVYWRASEASIDLAILPGATLRAPRGETLAAAVCNAVCDAEAAEASLSPDDVHTLAGPAALATADRWLYRDLTCVADGYLDRVFNRRLSACFTRRIIDLPITPNQVTLLHFALGMAAAALFWTGEYGLGILGALLLQYSVALDCSDGEVARLKYQFSRLGSQLDVAADNIVHVAVFAAIARAASAALGTGLALTLGALAATGIVMCVLTITLLARAARRRGDNGAALAASNRLAGDVVSEPVSNAARVDVVINEITSRDFTVLIVLAALFGRLDWMAWLAAFGSHAFWIGFAGLELLRTRRRHAEA